MFPEVNILWAIPITPIAYSLLTLGKSSKNSSMVIPFFQMPEQRFYRNTDTTKNGLSILNPGVNRDVFF